MSKRSEDIFKVEGERFLGGVIGHLVEFLANTSCMDEGYRIMIAKIEIFELLVEYEKEGEFDLISFISKVVKPSLERLGWAKWKRDILTDLALRSSKIQRKSVDFEELYKEDVE